MPASSDEDKSRGYAKYKGIAADLRAAIVAGEFPEGAQLPSETALRERYGVAGMTVRNALNELQQEGLVVARQGAGVFVQRFAPIVRASPDRLARTQWAAGRSVWEHDAAGRQITVDRIDVHEDQADELVARLLGIQPGARVWVRSRRYLLDGRPVQLAVSHLPADLVDGTPITQPNPGPGGTPARLAELGAAPVDHVEDVRGRPAEPAETDALNLGRGAFVFHIVRTSLTSAGRPVEVSLMVLDPNVYVLRYAFTTGAE